MQESRQHNTGKRARVRNAENSRNANIHTKLCFTQRQQPTTPITNPTMQESRQHNTGKRTRVRNAENSRNTNNQRHQKRNPTMQKSRQHNTGKRTRVRNAQECATLKIHATPTSTPNYVSRNANTDSTCQSHKAKCTPHQRQIHLAMQRSAIHATPKHVQCLQCNAQKSTQRQNNSIIQCHTKNTQDPHYATPKLRIGSEINKYIRGFTILLNAPVVGFGLPPRCPVSEMGAVRRWVVASVCAKKQQQ